MLDWLKEYIRSTPTSKLKDEWREIEEKFPVGVGAFEYIEYSNEAYKVCYKPPIDIGAINIVPKNMTPNFTGSYLF